MKQLVLSLTMVASIILVGCRGTSESVARPSPTATPVPATATVAPANTPTPSTTPVPTALPTPTAIPTPARRALADVNLEAIVTGAKGLPESYRVASEQGRADMFASLPPSANERFVDVSDGNDRSGFVGILLYESLSDLEQAYTELVSSFETTLSGDPATIVAYSVQGLGERAEAVAFVSNVELVNFAFIDASFVRCHGVGFVRFIVPMRPDAYGAPEVTTWVQKTVAYAKLLDNALTPELCETAAFDDASTPIVIVPKESSTTASSPATPAATLTPDPTLTPTIPPAKATTAPPASRSTTSGTSRTNPIPFGQTARVTRYGGDAVFEVAVVDVVRGATASQMMYDANMFNGEPSDPNLEWMLVRMKGKAVKVDDSTGMVFGDPLDMRIYASNRLVAQPLGGIPPEPHLQGVYLTGADLDGWVPFFTYQSDPNPVLFVEDSYLNDKGSYFALSRSAGQSDTPSESVPSALVTGVQVNIRQGPGTQYSVLGAGGQGSVYQIVGRNQDSSWWQICCVASQTGWVAGSVVTIQGDTTAVPVIQGDAPPTGQAQPAPSAGNWTLVADSVADFSGNLSSRKWWPLWSEGRFNFNWQDMRQDPNDCARIPGSYPGFICADRAGTDAQADLALQWKAPEGGTYLLEWQAVGAKGRGAVYIYRHLQEIYSTGRGPTLPNSVVVEDVDAWEQFFFVIRSDGDPYETTLQVRVYRR